VLVLDEALCRGGRCFPWFSGGKCSATASVTIEMLQTIILVGGAGNPASQPGTGLSGRLHGDAARSDVNDHRPMTVRPNLIEF
jgi:hypothetical protein